MKIHLPYVAAFASMLLLGVHANVHAAAQTAPRTYAILSLAGDSISTVTERHTIGSKLNLNEKQVIPIGDHVFDQSAIFAANEVIKKAAPDDKTVLLLTPDVGLYKAQNDMFESPAANADNRAFLKSLLTNRSVTHLVLITKARGEAQVWLTDIPVGTGLLEGLGYYINNIIDVRSNRTLNSGTGLLAPFAYLKIRLIDAGTMEVIKEVVQKEAHPIPNYTRDDLSAWSTLGAKEKIEYLQEIITRNVGSAVPKLIGDAAAK